MKNTKDSVNMQTLLELLKIPGSPGQERQVGEYIYKLLREIGVPEKSIVFDEAHVKSNQTGNDITEEACGNLIVRLDGHGKGERILLSAHMDTVPNAQGAKPEIQGDLVVNSTPDTALGSDNRSGCAVILAAVRALVNLDGDHPPCTIVFFVQEEIGLAGSYHLDVNMLGNPKPSMCFNWDGYHPHQIMTKVIGAERMHIRIKGLAAHSFNPEAGISAVAIAARALNRIDADGWHGSIKKGRNEGLSNIGIITGGQGSNVVMPDIYLLGEARSFNKEFRKEILKNWKEIFRDELKRAVSNFSGNADSAAVAFNPGPVYEACVLSENSRVVVCAKGAVKRAGLDPELCSNSGGMDSNNMYEKGIDSISFGTGDRNAHQVDEYLVIEDFENACTIAQHIALRNF